MKHLYDVCSKKGIPITTHGGAGGFVAVADKKELWEYTSLAKWEKVLEKYPDLKLNLAHLPMREKLLRVLPNPMHPVREAMLDLVVQHENVYVDFSYKAFGETYYSALRGVMDSLSAGTRGRLRDRILFGSDFAINLMWAESYNRYLDGFSRSSVLTPDEKHAFCSANPERFLFAPPDRQRLGGQR